MTRVVFWNIDHFGNELINSASTEQDTNVPSVTRQQAAAGRLAVILDTLQAAKPDIFVVIEMLGSKNVGTRIAGDNGGLTGAVFLLNELRTGTRAGLSSPTWRLVPPYWLLGSGNSSTEAVGIFYRGETAGGTSGTVHRYFTGPQLWSGGAKGVPTSSGTGQPYMKMTRSGANVDVNAMLQPPGTTERDIPGGALYNGGKKENVVAARFQFTQSPPATAGTAMNFGVARPPLLATFTEDDGGTLRNLAVFGVHPPANDVDAPQFIVNLAATESVTAALETAETRVIGGDFNVNVLDSSGNASAVYDPLKGVSYAPLLAPAGTAPSELAAYQGYFATHMDDVQIDTETRLRDSKLLWSASDTDLSPYPGYGYFRAAKNLFSLDNILVNPRRTSPHDYATTILNTVVGSPMNKVSSPPGNPPIGTVALPAGITVTGWPPAPNAPVFDATDAGTLMEWANYSRLRWTSDHFAVFADV